MTFQVLSKQFIDPLHEKIIQTTIQNTAHSKKLSSDILSYYAKISISHGCIRE